MPDHSNHTPRSVSTRRAVLSVMSYSQLPLVMAQGGLAPAQSDSKEKSSCRSNFLSQWQAGSMNYAYVLQSERTRGN